MFNLVRAILQPALDLGRFKREVEIAAIFQLG